ncbi:MAG TPA: tetratricopeptide repeat protein [Terriglobales bacterium]
MLKLTRLSDGSVTWQTTDDSSQGTFPNLPCSGYEIEVSAVGYLPAQRRLEVLDSQSPTEVQIALDPDPSAIGVDSSNTAMPPKAGKLVKSAIRLLTSDRFAQAQKPLDQAYRLAPASPDLNFLLGYLYFRKKDFSSAAGYLATASRLSPQSTQVFTLLGWVGLGREDYPFARSALEQAVMLDSESWLPHALLAATYLRQASYQDARDAAEIAIRKGKLAASPSHLILGESLLELGRTEEAAEAFNNFLRESPRHPMAAQVRNLLVEIQKYPTVAPADGTDVSHRPRLYPLDPLAALPAPGLSINSWKPRGIDEAKPYVAPAVGCPLTQVIDETGKRVTQLVEDVERFAAIEQLLHQVLDDYGIPHRTVTRKYNYVASVSEPKPGVVNVDEYRAGTLAGQSYPDSIATTGFAVLAFVFHPRMRESFAMACEGLGDWRGHASWLVHFRQRDDRPNYMHSYKIGNRYHPVGLKGRAWVTADTFQIVRIEAEIINPVPEIQLLSEHQVVEYGPVPFPRKNLTVWLPKVAQIYFDLRKHHYYRRHTFDHYMLYSVDSGEKRNEPAVAPN